MDADSWLLVGWIALSWGLAALMAASEMALAAVNRLELRQMLAAGHPRARMAEALLGNPSRLFATLLTSKICSYVSLTAGLILFAQRLGRAGGVAWALVAAVLLLLLAQVLPRAWVVGYNTQTALRFAPVVQVLAVLLTPLTAILRRLASAAAPAGTATQSIFLGEDGLRFLLNAAEEEASIEEDEKEMIASIFEFSDKLVREVMVPRMDMDAVSADVPMLEALDLILKNGHSRIPVYQDTADNIIGILNAKDLLRYLRDGRTDVPLRRILRPAYFIPESKKVDELLQELQQRRVHIAIVVDEYGGTAGIVTIEDLLEEIVGDIQDEYDAEEPTVEQVSEHEFLFDARIPLDEASKLLAVELPTEGGDTLGGFIYSQLGKVPAVGDTIEFDDVQIEVLSVAGRRIKQVRAVKRLGEQVAPQSGELTIQSENETTNGHSSATESVNPELEARRQSTKQPGFSRA